MVGFKSIFHILIVLCGSILLIGCSNNIATPYQYETDTYGNWTVNRNAINSDFMFREFIQEGFLGSEAILSPYQEWNWNHPPITVDDFLGNIINLVSFRGGNVYTLAISPTIMSDHNIDWHTVISRINVSEKYIDYYMYFPVSRLFNRMDFAHYLIFDNESDITMLYYVDSQEMNDGRFLNTIRRIHWSLAEEQAIRRFDTGHLTHDIYSIRRPFIAYADKYLIANYIDGNTYVLGYIMHSMYGGSAMQFIEVLRYEFTVDDNGLMTGRIPVYAMGDSQGFYFQVITLDNEMLDFGGESAVYFFCFQAQEYWHVLDLQDSVTYINGSGGVLVYSYHSVDSPRASTGRIAFLDTLETVVIPHVTPVNGIVSAYIGAEQIFVISANDIMVYTISTGAWEYLSLNELTPGQRTNAIFYDGQFGWLHFDEGQVTFYRAWQ